MNTILLGMAGSTVAVLQQKLLERGCFVPENESSNRLFGDATKAAILDFQAKHGLKPDGIVGPATWGALDKGADFIGDEPRPIPPGLPPLAAAILNVAHLEYMRPVVEDPFGSNRGPRIDDYLLGHRKDGDWLLDLNGPGRGAPWCGRFALWCVEEASKLIGVACPTQGWGDLASAPKWIQHGRAEARLYGGAKPGDVGVIIAGDHGHIVLVVDTDMDSAWTREGNSGNRIAARRRLLVEFAGFVRLV